MYCLLQTLKDTKVNDVVLYLGIKGKSFLVKDTQGKVYRIRSNKRLRPIEDENGKIHAGKICREWGTEFDFFGYLNPDYWDQVEPDTSLRAYI